MEKVEILARVIEIDFEHDPHRAAELVMQLRRDLAHDLYPDNIPPAASRPTIDDRPQSRPRGSHGR